VREDAHEVSRRTKTNFGETATMHGDPRAARNRPRGSSSVGAAWPSAGGVRERIQTNTKSRQSSGSPAFHARAVSSCCFADRRAVRSTSAYGESPRLRRISVNFTLCFRLSFLAVEA